MYTSPTRQRNGNPATASRNPVDASPPMPGANLVAIEAVRDLTQMLLGHGIDSSNPNPGHTGSKIRLPLQYFDNTDLERNTPEGWVEQTTRQAGKRSSTQPTAILLLTDESGVGQWRLGRVFRWDAASSTFHAHLASALGMIQQDSSVALPRLSVCFLSEPMHEFSQRVAAPQHVHNHAYRAAPPIHRSGLAGARSFRCPVARRWLLPRGARPGDWAPYTPGDALVLCLQERMHACMHTCIHACRRHTARATRQRRSSSSASM